MNVYRLQAKTDTRRSISNLAVLARVPVSVAVAVVSMLGYLLYTPEFSVALFATGFGSFFLCAGCSALNQVQEKRTDGYFSRTMSRPLPQGYMRARTALLIALVCILLAASLYVLTASKMALVVAFMTLVIYNGVYTGMKRRSPYALLVGSIAGAMPPLMGWVAAGGSMFDPLILANCLIWYLGQIPHVWMRIYMHKEEYLSRFSPIPVSYFALTYHTLLIRVWYFAYVSSVMIFALVCTWGIGAPSFTGLALGSVFLLGSMIPLTRLSSFYLFDIASVCVLLGAVILQL
ncbi:UbiA family prenyltransferase [Halodesulfovibrio marinisediminis]|uniref:heme o synthase n=1 Tax=Halodesulfovibrio marinisediminis DSM 17456 TaxID=1121457 RepID=A0A1N6I4Z4_9BACT|nr:UbiA family prenyltransferase [Halodesulfovibrio marinisediminis]SIO27090.1 protoheme IX farnesyltransferase [Halodesulfovibrio marinisediminis DSM 17456]